MTTAVAQLQTEITENVAQLKSAVAFVSTQSSESLLATQAASAMETEVNNSLATTMEISTLIANLKREIATITSHPTVTKLDISNLIADLKSVLALIKSHPLFCNLSPI